MNLLEELIKRNILAKADVASIREAMRASGITVEEALLEHGVSADAILQVKSEYLNVPARSLAGVNVPFSILRYVPEESASHYKFVPIDVKDGILEVGLVDPENIEARDALNFISGKVNLPFKVFLISEEDFKSVVELYKGLSGEVTKALDELGVASTLDEGIEVSSASGEEPANGKIDAKIIEDAPVTKIVATILRYAAEGNASDVHIEPMREKVRVRFRVDGTLNTSLILPLNVLSSVIARIKVLSNMKLDEKRKPQDGRFSARIDGRKIDFRVSTFPTYFGEKVVMRILDQEKGVKPLADMGLTPKNLQLLRDAIDRPYGMILISGPTGSGKTTTLYSMLTELDRESSNVLSLEDPIEYNIEGMSQSQVRPEIGYTFATGLRTTLRQDPDIIMVGEIRDKETAQLAVQAALTGHLVLSTIHTNNAAGVIPRLIDMGVDPYLIAPTLILAIGQRLVRLRCPASGGKKEITGDFKTYIDKELKDVPMSARKEGLDIPDFVYTMESSPDCPSGTRGRAGVFEILSMDKELEALIPKTPTEIDIMKVARGQGMLTIREDALRKAFAGEIPFEEVTKL